MKAYPADLVNPYIGTISHLLKSIKAEVMLPHSAVRSSAKVHDCDDYFCNDYVDGFMIGSSWIMPGYGDGIFLNTLDHSRETVKCYYSRTELEEGNIVVEATVAPHTYFYRITGGRYLRITAQDVQRIEASDSCIKIYNTNENNEWNRKRNEFILIKFNKHFEVISQSEHEVILLLEDNLFEVYASVSYISFDKAQEIFEKEVTGSSFEETKLNAFNTWNELLSRVELEGNTEDKKVVFYTAMYRAFQRMTNASEYGQYYSGFDKKVHDGDYFYVNDGLWDTFRCMHPLQMLLDTKRQEQIADSYIKMYEQSGLMPSFPGDKEDLPVMIGFHAASLFADAYAKGLKLDYETAYEGIKKNALTETMLPWRCGMKSNELDKCYYEKGFFPALKRGEEEFAPEVNLGERRQSVAVTLEHAYDDWCVAQLAKALGKHEDYELFMKRSKNYVNLYNKEIGYMAPRSADGKWIDNFNPKWDGGQGGRDYTAENNTLTYTWSVFHDLEGLFELMGGKEMAEKKLDKLFYEGLEGGYKFTYLSQFPDATGLMGQFAMGNEPSFHIPYIYDYMGTSWKAQKRLRDLMDIWFINNPTGICGDEDGGAMSSWFVFSAMGFYPVCPGKAEYALGTPIFDKATIKLDNGNVFSVISEGAGTGKRYIQSAMINGTELDKPFIKHEDIMKGGSLVLTMGSKPRKNW